MVMEFDVERGRQESNQALEGLPRPLRLRAGVLTNGATVPPRDRVHDKREWSPRGQAGNPGISGGVACKFGLRPAGFGSKRREKYAAHFLIVIPPILKMAHWKTFPYVFEMAISNGTTAYRLQHILAAQHSRRLTAHRIRILSYIAQQAACFD